MENDSIRYRKCSLREKIPIPPLKPLPLEDVPMWKTLPYDTKYPLLKYSKKVLSLSREELGKSLYPTFPSKDFDLTQSSVSEKSTYNSLHDPHLRQYFQYALRFKSLLRKGLVTKDGKVKSRLKEFNQYRMYLYHLWALQVNQLSRTQMLEERKRLESLLKAYESEDSFFSDVAKKYDKIKVEDFLEEAASRIFENKAIIAEHGFSPFIRSVIQWKIYQEKLLKFRSSYPDVKQWLSEQTKHYKQLMENKLNARRNREKKLKNRWERICENSRTRLKKELKVQEQEKERKLKLNQQRYNRVKSLWTKDEQTEPLYRIHFKEDPTAQSEKSVSSACYGAGTSHGTSQTTSSSEDYVDHKANFGRIFKDRRIKRTTSGESARSDADLDISSDFSDIREDVREIAVRKNNHQSNLKKSSKSDTVFLMDDNLCLEGKREDNTPKIKDRNAGSKSRKKQEMLKNGLELQSSEMLDNEIAQRADNFSSRDNSVENFQECFKKRTIEEETDLTKIKSGMHKKRKKVKTTDEDEIVSSKRSDLFIENAAEAAFKDSVEKETSSRIEKDESFERSTKGKDKDHFLLVRLAAQSPEGSVKGGHKKYCLPLKETKQSLERSVKEGYEEKVSPVTKVKQAYERTAKAKDGKDVPLITEARKSIERGSKSVYKEKCLPVTRSKQSLERSTKSEPEKHFPLVKEVKQPSLGPYEQPQLTQFLYGLPEIHEISKTERDGEKHPLQSECPKIVLIPNERKMQDIKNAEVSVASRNSMMNILDKSEHDEHNNILKALERSINERNKKRQEVFGLEKEQLLARRRKKIWTEFCEYFTPGSPQKFLREKVVGNDKDDYSKLRENEIENILKDSETVERCISQKHFQWKKDHAMYSYMHMKPMKMHEIKRNCNSYKADKVVAWERANGSKENLYFTPETDEHFKSKCLKYRQEKLHLEFFKYFSSGRSVAKIPKVENRPDVKVITHEDNWRKISPSGSIKDLKISEDYSSSYDENSRDAKDFSESASESNFKPLSFPNFILSKLKKEKDVLFPFYEHSIRAKVNDLSQKGHVVFSQDKCDNAIEEMQHHVKSGGKEFQIRNSRKIYEEDMAKKMDYDPVENMALKNQRDIARDNATRDNCFEILTQDSIEVETPRNKEKESVSKIIAEDKLDSAIEIQDSDTKTFIIGEKEKVNASKTITRDKLDSKIEPADSDIKAVTTPQKENASETIIEDKLDSEIRLADNDIKGVTIQEKEKESASESIIEVELYNKNAEDFNIKTSTSVEKESTSKRIIEDTLNREIGRESSDIKTEKYTNENVTEAELGKGSEKTIIDMQNICHDFIEDVTDEKATDIHKGKISGIAQDYGTLLNEYNDETLEMHGKNKKYATCIDLEKSTIQNDINKQTEGQLLMIKASLADYPKIKDDSPIERIVGFDKEIIRLDQGMTIPVHEKLDFIPETFLDMNDSFKEIQEIIPNKNISFLYSFVSHFHSFSQNKKRYKCNPDSFDYLLPYFDNKEHKKSSEKESQPSSDFKLQNNLKEEIKNPIEPKTTHEEDFINISDVRIFDISDESEEVIKIQPIKMLSYIQTRKLGTKYDDRQNLSLGVESSRETCEFPVSICINEPLGNQKELRDKGPEIDDITMNIKTNKLGRAATENIIGSDSQFRLSETNSNNITQDDQKIQTRKEAKFSYFDLEQREDSLDSISNFIFPKKIAHHAYIPSSDDHFQYLKTFLTPRSTDIIIKNLALRESYAKENEERSNFLIAKTVKSEDVKSVTAHNNSAHIPADVENAGSFLNKLSISELKDKISDRENLETQQDTPKLSKVKAYKISSLKDSPSFLPMRAIYRSLEEVIPTTSGVRINNFLRVPKTKIVGLVEQESSEQARMESSEENLRVKECIKKVDYNRLNQEISPGSQVIPFNRGTFPGTKFTSEGKFCNISSKSINFNFSVPPVVATLNEKNLQLFLSECISDVLQKFRENKSFQFIAEAKPGLNEEENISNFHPELDEQRFSDYVSSEVIVSLPRESSERSLSGASPERSLSEWYPETSLLGTYPATSLHGAYPETSLPEAYPETSLIGAYSETSLPGAYSETSLPGAYPENDLLNFKQDKDIVECNSVERFKILEENKIAPPGGGYKICFVGKDTSETDDIIKESFIVDFAPDVSAKRDSSLDLNGKSPHDEDKQTCKSLQSNNTSKVNRFNKANTINIYEVEEFVEPMSSQEQDGYKMQQDSESDVLMQEERTREKKHGGVIGKILHPFKTKGSRKRSHRNSAKNTDVFITDDVETFSEHDEWSNQESYAMPIPKINEHAAESIILHPQFKVSVDQESIFETRGCTLPLTGYLSSDSEVHQLPNILRMRYNSAKVRDIADKRIQYLKDYSDVSGSG